MQERLAQAAKFQAEAASHAAGIALLQQTVQDLHAALAEERAATSAALQQVGVSCCTVNRSSTTHSQACQLHSVHSVPSLFSLNPLVACLYL